MAENYRQLINCSQILIAKTWRKYKQRNWYISIYSAIVRLQIQFQVRKRKRQFLLSVQGKLRTIKLKISNITNIQLFDREGLKLNNNSISSPGQSKVKKREYCLYVIVNVYDLGQGNSIQTWRLESPTISLHILPHTITDILLDEKFILGGVSGNQHLVLSIFQKGAIRDVFLGQVSLELATNNLWKKGGKFTLPLQLCGYELKDVAGMDMKADFHLVPRGIITFEVVTTHGMNAECCSCFGTSPEEIIRSLAKLPDTTGFILPQKKIVGHHAAVGARGGGNVSSAVSIASSVVSIATSLTGNNSAIQLEGNVGMKKLWIAVTEGKLYVYGHFGDALKLTIDLQFFSVAFDFAKGKNVVYKLSRMGYPEFHFYPTVPDAIFRMKCAFLSSLRFAKGFAISATNMPSNQAPFQNNHGQPQSSEIPQTSTIGEKFDVNYLVSDLLALEILKSKKNAYKEAGGSFLNNLNVVSKVRSIANIPINNNINNSNSNSNHNTNQKLLSAPATRNSVHLSPIQRNSSTTTIRKSNIIGATSSFGGGGGLRQSQPGIDLPKNLRASLFMPPEAARVEDDLIDACSHDTAEMFTPKLATTGKSDKKKKKPKKTRGSILRSSLTETTLEALTGTQKLMYEIMASEANKKKDETRQELEYQVIEEMAIEELSANQNYQNVGEFFIKNLISDAAEHKVQEHFSKERQRSLFSLPSSKFTSPTPKSTATFTSYETD
jgi:hypothetical protein